MGTQLKDGNVGRMGMVQVTIDPAALAANTTAEQTFTVNGLAVGDVVMSVKPSHTAAFGVGNARVSATNTLALTFINPSAGAPNPGPEVWTVLWFRPEVGNPAVLPGAVQV